MKSAVSFIVSTIIFVLTLIEVLLHVILVFGVEEVVAAFSQQISWHVAKDVHHTLIDEGEFAVH